MVEPKGMVTTTRNQSAIQLITAFILRMVIFILRSTLYESLATE